MRLVLVLILAMWSNAATAETIGLFADSLGTDCNIQIPFPGGAVTAYAIGTRSQPVVREVTSAAFRIEGLPAGWTSQVTQGPAVSILIGNPFAEGAAIVFTGCRGETRLLLWRVEITPTSSVDNVDLNVLPHLEFGESCGIEDGCGGATVHFCDCNKFTQCVPAQGVTSHINGAPCFVSVAAKAWDQVKRLYR